MTKKRTSSGQEYKKIRNAKHLVADNVIGRSLDHKTSNFEKLRNLAWLDGAENRLKMMPEIYEPK